MIKLYLTKQRPFKNMGVPVFTDRYLDKSYKLQIIYKNKILKTKRYENLVDAMEALSLFEALYKACGVTDIEVVY